MLQQSANVKRSHLNLIVKTIRNAAGWNRSHLAGKGYNGFKLNRYQLRQQLGTKIPTTWWEQDPAMATHLTILKHGMPNLILEGPSLTHQHTSTNISCQVVIFLRG